MNNKPLIISTQIEKATDILALNQSFIRRFYFRGQANSQWELETSLRRKVSLHNPNYVDCNLPALYEAQMLEEFQWKYPLYAQGIIPNKDDSSEWLSLMQHYGASTRLLDFSHSIYVALFMALDDSFYESSAIWCINKSIILCETFEAYRESVEPVKSFSQNQSIVYSNELARKYINRIHHIDTCPKQVIAINPSICNERICKQQGLFLMPTNIMVSFCDNLENTIGFPINFESAPFQTIVDYSYTQQGKHSQRDIALLKIEIPIRLKLELTRILNQMNLTAETLYPGLVGLAKSMNQLKHGMGEYDE